MDTEKHLLKLCRAALGEDTPEDAALLSSLDGDAWTAVYRLAKHHDLGHLVAAATRRLSLAPPTEIAAKLEKQSMIAIYRTEQMTYELRSLTEALSAAGIAHLPLKGSVLRAYYPSPELRLSCDVDLLVRREELSAARAVLTDLLGYTDGGENSHDVSTYAPSGLHVELHFDLIETGYLPEAAALLADVWAYATPVSDGAFTYRLSDEMFYFYHIAHMAKHLTETGGCGVRPFLDLLVLERAGRCGEPTERARLLSLGGLSAFEEAARELMRVWLRGEPFSPRSEALSTYVLTGGTYGVVENRVAVAYGRGKNRFTYLLSRLFPPYRHMSLRYPCLKRLPFLTPVFYFLRLLSPLWSGRARAVAKEARASGSISGAAGADVGALLRELGLPCE